MRIPKSFTCKGKRWKIRTKRRLKIDGEELDGLCDFNKRIIYLNADLKAKQRARVLKHELGHVMIHEAHINPGTRFSESVEEIICDAFEDFLTTLFTIKWKKQK